METVAFLKDSYKVSLSDVIWSVSACDQGNRTETCSNICHTTPHPACVRSVERLHTLSELILQNRGQHSGGGRASSGGGLTLEIKVPNHIDTDAVFILSALFPGHTNS